MKFGIGEYVTRDGRKAVVENINERGIYSLHGNVGNVGFTWTDDGELDVEYGESELDLISPWQSYQHEGKELDMTMTDEFKEAAEPILESMYRKPGELTFIPYGKPTPIDTLRDKTFRAALTGLLASGEWMNVDEVVIQAAIIADEAMKQRDE